MRGRVQVPPAAVFRPTVRGRCRGVFIEPRGEPRIRICTDGIRSAYAGYARFSRNVRPCDRAGAASDVDSPGSARAAARKGRGIGVVVARVEHPVPAVRRVEIAVRVHVDHSARGTEAEPRITPVERVSGVSVFTGPRALGDRVPSQIEAAGVSRNVYSPGAGRASARQGGSVGVEIRRVDERVRSPTEDSVPGLPELGGRRISKGQVSLPRVLGSDDADGIARNAEDGGLRLHVGDVVQNLVPKGCRQVRRSSRPRVGVVRHRKLRKRRIPGRYCQR